MLKTTVSPLAVSLLTSSLLASSVALVACEGPSPTTSAPSASVKPSASADVHSLGPSRADFNRLAAELYAPLFWVDDKNKNSAPDAAELAVLWGVDGSSKSDWLAGGKLTPKAKDAIAKIAAAHTTPPIDAKADAAEKKRQDLVRQELAQGMPTLLHNDFSKASAQDKAIVKHILAASKIIERMHGKQIGSWQLRDKVPSHPASKMLFYRNQGPWCVAPATEKEAACSAIPSAPKKVSGLYPAALQSDEGFCEALKKEPNAKTLRHQFHVVTGEPGKLQAVSYNEHFADDAKLVIAELEKTAAAITSADEEAFKAYLLAAAKAFGDNNWEPADEAWAAMDAKNSKWYLRIGPDETYFEPCSTKAGYHVSFARINQDSLEWQRKLDPVKGDMEKAIAALAGEPYKARKVGFDLPDFIDIVVNAGDSRSPHGATIGQSLPNWGPVANEGRGRTVAMTNLYTDADSRRSLEAQAASMLCPLTMKKFTSDPKPQIMGTVLHEAAHNLGPAHEYKVDGKKDREIFEGPMASMLEELKAQTAALYYTDWLVEKKVLSKDEAEKAHVRDITWAFGHISRGMYTATKRPRPYSQLAAIQVHYLVKEGAITWNATGKAANGKDTGCAELLLDKFPAVVEQLMKDVAGIKARGDKEAAAKLKADYVDVDGERRKLMETITERWLRAPKASFVYAIDL